MPLQQRILVAPWVTGVLVAVLAVATPARAQMSPEEELAHLRTAEDFDLSLFASEPHITNPAAIDIDTQGRVWVAEIQWYRSRAKTDPPADKIKVLEDTDHDGRADKVTVFAENVFAPMSVCVAGDKVYVATSPDLWVYEDKDGDLRADGPPTKLLTGFGGFNHDHGAHSIILGPDHKWWMSHGDAGFSVTGTDGSKVEFRWGAVLRGELDGSKLDTVAVNFRNTYEVCVTSQGESYLSDNDDDGNESVRICWIMPGGNYGWFGRPPFGKRQLDMRVPPGTPFRESWHFRGFTPGYVPATIVTGFGSPCGILFQEEDVFGEKYQNVAFHADAGPRVVRVYRHTDKGFGKIGTSEDVVWSEGDDYFRPDDVCQHPDGSIYISDWYDGGVGGHAYNDPDRGRIFVLRPRGESLTRRESPGPYASITDAINGLSSPNLATQYLARERLLAEGAATLEPLRELLGSLNANTRARALWVLDRIGGEGRTDVLNSLEADDAATRALGIRILARHGGAYASEILRHADDEDPAVRREVLLAIPAFAGEERELARDTAIRAALAMDGQDRYEFEAVHLASQPFQEEVYEAITARDPYEPRFLPLLRLLDPERLGVALLDRIGDPRVSPNEKTAQLRTIAEYNGHGFGRALLQVAANAEMAAAVRLEALRLLSSQIGEKWSGLLDDKALTDTLAALMADSTMREAALEAIATIRPDGVGSDVVALADDERLDVALRCRALEVASGLNGAVPVLSAAIQRHLNDEDARIRAAALEAAIKIADAQTLRSVVANSELRERVGPELITGLLESAGGALLLFPLVAEHELTHAEMEIVLPRVADHPDANVRALFEEFIPEERRSRKIGQAISADEILALQGRAERGRRIFFQSSAAQCNNCHGAEGQGSTFGPDLSKIGAKYERAALLETILQPSKAIAPEFVPHVVVRTDGRVVIGFLIERNDQQIRIKNEKSEVVDIPFSEVESLSRRDISLMPEVVFRDITAQDAADLLEYLTTLR